MTDRELLELAAKAAGIPTGGWALDQSKGMRVQDNYGDFLCFWNPLDDDGDALRLAVHIGVNISIQSSFVIVTFLHGHKTVRGMQWTEGFGSDPNAATRRTIVRAAAEIGRNIL